MILRSSRGWWLARSGSAEPGAAPDRRAPALCSSLRVSVGGWCRRRQVSWVVRRRDGVRMERDRPDLNRPPNAFQRRLAWAGVKALIMAALNLALLRGVDRGFLILFGLPPCFAAAHTGFSATRGERRVAWAFLVAIGVGAFVSQLPALLPKLGGVDRRLAPEHDRMLTWYAAVYLVFLTGVLPAFLFIRALRKHRVGEPAGFSRFTCYLGLFTVGLMWLGMPGVLALLGFWPLM